MEKVKETDSTLAKETRVEEKEETVRISPRTGKPVQTKYSSVNHKKKAKKRYPNKSKNGKNSPVIGTNGYSVKQGDNNEITVVNLELFNLPAIDMDDVDQVTDRLNEYFQIFAKHDMKPTLSGMAMALNGMSRQTLTAIAHDTATGSDGYKTALPPDVTACIKKAYHLQENLWESYMVGGKLNPVTGIFLGKNNYGYVDKQEHVLTPNAQNDNDYDAEEIKKRYMIEDKDTE